MRGLSLTKLVPEWGRSDSLTTWICIYRFFSSVWHLIVIFWYLLVLSAVPGDYKERWGWLAGGGFFLDPSDSRVDPAMLLKSCGCCWRIPAEVVGVCPVRDHFTAEHRRRCLWQIYYIFFRVSWRGGFILPLPGQFLLCGLEHRHATVLLALVQNVHIQNMDF